MACDVGLCAATSAACLGLYGGTLLASRFLFSPAVAPVTYRKLAGQPGQQGYWDSSVASTLNGIVNTILVFVMLWRDPRLVSSLADPFYVTEDTCGMVVLFATWCAFDLAQVFYYWGLWDGTLGMLVHHGCAVIAWLLYLEGGYGHNLSLVGVLCEATNPFMNMRYMLHVAELKESKLYMINGLLFCLSWLLVRILFAIPLGTYIIVQQWSALAPAIPTWRLLIYPGFFGVGVVLNLVWGYRLLRGALKLLTAPTHAKGS